MRNNRRNIHLLRTSALSIIHNTGLLKLTLVVKRVSFPFTCSLVIRFLLWGLSRKREGGIERESERERVCKLPGKPHSTTPFIPEVSIEMLEASSSYNLKDWTTTTSKDCRDTTNSACLPVLNKLHLI